MSGEYYGTEKPVPKLYNNDFEAASSQVIKEKVEPAGQDNRLTDIEEQLEVAEDRCNTLKGQLDYMKQIYGTKKKSRKISSVHSNVVKTSDDDTQNFSTSSISVASENKGVPKTQTSNAIGTDNTGAAVRTINNILTGITDSVNKLSELHVQIAESPRNRSAANQLSGGIPLFKVTQETEHPKDVGSLHSPRNIHTLSKMKGNKRKCRETKAIVRKQVSSQVLKRNVKVDRRINSATFSTTTSKVASATIPADFPVKSLTATNKPKLVEIFHSKEAKSSDSDEFQKNKQPCADGDHRSIQMCKDEIPALKIPNCTYQEISQTRNSRRFCQSGFSEDCCYHQTVNESIKFQKNYELPTIASRLKQVAKTYLNSFSIKTVVCNLVGAKLPDERIHLPRKAIPFCAAISTSPSHNIGINIQQVMNILKNRQPVNGISPTLAHNIGLAAERLNSKPLSTLVSTINSNTCCVKPQQCPLSKCKLNYQYLQDLAKSIPEETVEEVEGEDQQEIKTIIITGPSGDMEIRSKNIPQWVADRSNDVCTCIPNTGPALSYVRSRVKQSGNAIISQTSVIQKPKDVNKWKTKNDRRPQTTQPTYSTASDNPFEGKEKSLKLVLTHLHDEFEQLNSKYENLSRSAVGKDDPETLNELEILERELNKKEEEITMVMELCKEVMALKQQIKNLKQNNSLSSFPQERKDSQSSDVNDFNNPQAAFHLTKLLKQIQTYQLKYKKGIGA